METFHFTEFFLGVGITALVAVPIGWWFIQNSLQDIQQHVNLIIKLVEDKNRYKINSGQGSLEIPRLDKKINSLIDTVNRIKSTVLQIPEDVERILSQNFNQTGIPRTGLNIFIELAGETNREILSFMLHCGRKNVLKFQNLGKKSTTQLEYNLISEGLLEVDEKGDYSSSYEKYL